jgi:hypothetical protein
MLSVSGFAAPQLSALREIDYNWAWPVGRFSSMGEVPFPLVLPGIRHRPRWGFPRPIWGTAQGGPAVDPEGSAASRVRFTEGLLWKHEGMRAELWRDTHYVGFLVVAAGGKVTQDFTPTERERIEPILAEIEQRLSETGTWAGGGSDKPPVSGDRRWFDRFLEELEKKGYEHRVLEDDGFGRDGAAGS